MAAPGPDLLDGVVVDRTTKGFAVATEPVRLREVGSRGWTLRDLQPPVLVLRRSALEHNLSLMARFCDERGVAIAPHGKTTMAPQLWRRQLDAGAWGITAATAVQARVMRAAGVRNVLVANELTDAASIRWAAEDLQGEGTELICYVDGLRGVELLERGLREASAPRPLPVLVELGHRDGRTGCRDPAAAAQLARRVAASAELALAGVAGFEGTIAHDRGPASLAGVRAYLGEVRGLAERLLAEGVLAPRPILTAGGSHYFDLVADALGDGWPDGVDPLVLLRSGCYLTHDAGFYERASPFAREEPGRRFRPALEAWGVVLSRPEPGLALLGLGRRDVPFDQDLPRPLSVVRGNGAAEAIDGRVRITALNDQHAFCRLTSEADLEVGDLVRCGISHPCTAFDRSRVIPVLDEDDRVVDAVATFF
jgi:D-serine deaminase-like pyridoxal phosphate-dependent protein